jgi:nicotinamide riboside kinase
LAKDTRRICLIGPECTGKSTLAERAERELGAVWVREYAREYVERVRAVLSAEDVEPIARGEIANLDAAADAALVVLDTDLISTVVYARHYYGSCPEWIEEEARRRRARALDRPDYEQLRVMAFEVASETGAEVGERIRSLFTFA